MLHILHAFTLSVVLFAVRGRMHNEIEAKRCYFLPSRDVKMTYTIKGKVMELNEAETETQIKMLSTELADVAIDKLGDRARLELYARFVKALNESTLRAAESQPREETHSRAGDFESS